MNASKVDFNVPGFKIENLKSNRSQDDYQDKNI